MTATWRTVQDVGTGAPLTLRDVRLGDVGRTIRVNGVTGPLLSIGTHTEWVEEHTMFSTRPELVPTPMTVRLTVGTWHADDLEVDTEVEFL